MILGLFRRVVVAGAFVKALPVAADVVADMSEHLCGQAVRLQFLTTDSDAVGRGPDHRWRHHSHRG
jgi:hypothetical protein